LVKINDKNQIEYFYKNNDQIDTIKNLEDQFDTTRQIQGLKE